MRCHARQNRPHLAAQQYELCSRELRAELGLAPDPETTRLYEAVRQRRPI
jgi:DNA-binding SARP family transcriptional activator